MLSREQGMSIVSKQVPIDRFVGEQRKFNPPERGTCGEIRLHYERVQQDRALSLKYIAEFLLINLKLAPPSEICAVRSHSAFGIEDASAHRGKQVRH
jgi:hypothetical protein